MLEWAQPTKVDFIGNGLRRFNPVPATIFTGPSAERKVTGRGESTQAVIMESEDADTRTMFREMGFL